MTPTVSAPSQRKDAVSEEMICGSKRFSSMSQVTAASAVQGLVVHQNGEIRVLKRDVHAQDCIVGALY